MDAPKSALHRLEEAFERRELTLLVGAGASVASGLPSWTGLLAGIFINSLHGIRTTDSELLQATAETWIEQVHARPDIVARQLRAAFASPDEFLKWVRFALYKWVPCTARGLPTRAFIDSLQENETLGAIASLCRSGDHTARGIRRVISYNFDDLLELRLGDYAHQSIWSQTDKRPGKLPIYHVHGFLPTRLPWSPYPRGRASRADEIVLTEDQYHREALNTYGWSNLVQLQSLSDSICLTVGLSISDPNMRRILDIAARSSSRPEVYALLGAPSSASLDDSLLGAIYDRIDALRSREGFWPGASEKGSIKRTPGVASRAGAIWRQLDALEQVRQVKVMRELGVHPIWCTHGEIPSFLGQISGRRTTTSGEP